MAVAQAPSEARRRPGRPKREWGDPERQVREEILVAASRLFAEQGFKGTSMRQIADELNLRGPSIYHYFSDKKDILREIARYTIETSLLYADSLSDDAGPASQQLYDMLFEHVGRLCASPYNLKGLVEVKPSHFEGLDEWRDQVFRWGQKLRKVIQHGIRDGEFRPVDLDLSYVTIIGAIASVLQPISILSRPPRETAEYIARFVVNALLVEGKTIAAR